MFRLGLMILLISGLISFFQVKNDVLTFYDNETFLWNEHIIVITHDENPYIFNPVITIPNTLRCMDEVELIIPKIYEILLDEKSHYQIFFESNHFLVDEAFYLLDDFFQTIYGRHYSVTDELRAELHAFSFFIFNHVHHCLLYCTIQMQVDEMCGVLQATIPVRPEEIRARFNF